MRSIRGCAFRESVVACVAKNPGQLVEQIGKALGVATKELQLPILRMNEAKGLHGEGPAARDAVRHAVGVEGLHSMHARSW